MKRRNVLKNMAAAGALLAMGPLPKISVGKTMFTPADKPVILECAVNGSTTKATNPIAPETKEELIDEIIRCFEEGVTIVHSHSNKPNENVKAAADPYIEIFKPVIKKFPHAIMYATANFDPKVYNKNRKPWSGEIQTGHQRLIAESGYSNMILFDTGIVPIGSYDKKGLPGPDSGFWWYGFWPDDVRIAHGICEDLGTGASISVFEPGWMKNVVAMVKAGTLPRGSKLNIYFASEDLPLCAPPTPEALELYLKMMEGLDLKWAVGYIGNKSVMDTPLARMALERGGSFRVGLEDWPNGDSNLEQIKRAKEIINSVGRPIITGAEAIKHLDIPFEATQTER